MASRGRQAKNPRRRCCRWRGRSASGRARLGGGDDPDQALERRDAGAAVGAALQAFLQRGQALGTLKVSLASGAPVTEVPLVVLETVEESGILGRAWDALRLWIQ